MRSQRPLLAAVAAFWALQGSAAPSAEEIASLGTTLTAFGAEKAGNKDGTIPEYTGGLCSPPAGYKPRDPNGGFPYVDPFAEEKPLFSIDGRNMERHLDKLDEGAKRLLKQFPGYRMDVYPTHRTFCAPKWAYDNTIRNAGKPRLVGDAPGIDGARQQIPFPIPKNGHEVMWNFQLRFKQPHERGDYENVFVDAAGHMTRIARSHIFNRHEYWDPAVANPQTFWDLINTIEEPAAKAGEIQMRVNPLRMDLKDPMAWIYVPGQRRVRLAPEFKYDTVAAAVFGTIVYDETSGGFDGKMDRFDFKLVGKKEMYVPYNNYRFHHMPVDKVATKDFINPEAVRWELHRVWLVEATLKPGARHIYSKKLFYFDEDSWSIVNYAGIDHEGKLYRSGPTFPHQAYEVPAMRNETSAMYDHLKGQYVIFSKAGANQSHWRKTAPLPPNYFSVDTIAGGGVR
jgi:hypothetical protein